MLASIVFAGQRLGAGPERVLEPELQRIHADGGGYELHVPLDRPVELHVAEAAVGGAVGLVGVDRVRVEPGVGYLVGAGGGVARGARHVDRVVGVGAGVPVHGHVLGQ